MKFTTQIKKTCTRTEVSSDYLKYWRVVRHWAIRTYGLSQPDLEMLLFLHSERLFKKSDFKEFECIFSWDRHRWNRLLNDGWISMWRDRHNGEAALFEVSRKGKQLMNTIYRKLEGKELISESPARNPMFKADASYSDNMLKRPLRKMKRTQKEKKRLSDLEEQEYQKQPHVVKYHEVRKTFREILKDHNDVSL